MGMSSSPLLSCLFLPARQRSSAWLKFSRPLWESACNYIKKCCRAGFGFCGNYYLINDNSCLEFQLLVSSVSPFRSVVSLNWRHLNQPHKKSCLQDVYKSLFHSPELLVIQDLRQSLCVCACVHAHTLCTLQSGSCVLAQPDGGQGMGLSMRARGGISRADCLRQEAIFCSSPAVMRHLPLNLPRQLTVFSSRFALPEPNDAVSWFTFPHCFFQSSTFAYLCSCFVVVETLTWLQLPRSRKKWRGRSLHDPRLWSHHMCDSYFRNLAAATGGTCMGGCKVWLAKEHISRIQRKQEEFCFALKLCWHQISQYWISW